MKRKNEGFTLVELLIVTAIIVVLALLGGTNYIAAQKKGRDARRVSDMEQVKAALEMYRVDKGRYPYDTNANPADCELCTSVSGAANFTAMNTILKNEGYTNTIFSDPGGRGYEYLATKDPPGALDGTGYSLCAHLERDSGTSCASGLSGNYELINP